MKVKYTMEIKQNLDRIKMDNLLYLVCALLIYFTKCVVLKRFIIKGTSKPFFLQ